jgi:hypothetical protein
VVRTFQHSSGSVIRMTYSGAKVAKKYPNNNTGSLKRNVLCSASFGCEDVFDFGETSFCSAIDKNMAAKMAGSVGRSKIARHTGPYRRNHQRSPLVTVAPQFH